MDAAVDKLRKHYVVTNFVEVCKNEFGAGDEDHKAEIIESLKLVSRSKMVTESIDVLNKWMNTNKYGSMFTKYCIALEDFVEDESYLAKCKTFEVKTPYEKERDAMAAAAREARATNPADVEHDEEDDGVNGNDNKRKADGELPGMFGMGDFTDLGADGGYGTDENLFDELAKVGKFGKI